MKFSGCEPVDSLVLASLWLLCAYGGLGARTRRGFGGLRITGLDGPLPHGWTEAAAVSPPLSHYEDLCHLWPAERMPGWLGQLRAAIRGHGDHPPPPPGEQDAWQTRPSYPVLSRRWTRAATRTGQPRPQWREVLGYAAQEYRWFRAAADTPGVHYQPQIKTREWLETIHGDDDRFSVGALGLPVVFKGSDYTVNAYRGDDGLRRASPLWIRAVGADDGWKLFTFAFHGDFLPDDVRVRVGKAGSSRELVVTDDDVVTRTGRWIDGIATGTRFVRGRTPPRRGRSR